MERKDRPVGRKKNVLGGSGHVGRRQGAAGVGGGAFGGKRPGGSSSSAPRQNSSQRSGEQRGVDLGDVANLVGAVTSATGSGKKKPSLVTILIVVAVLVFGGGGLGSLTGLFGDGSGDINSLDTPNISTPNYTATTSSGKVDTSVSSRARDKRVALAGDGSDTTTILVYLCGTDLESSGGFATKDLQEMAAAEIGDNVRLLVFTGGCKSWRNSLVSNAKNQIYQVMDGGFKLQWEGDSLQAMTDPDTLSDFIQWGARNYPADRYELIFWDHGGGSLSGYGYDEVYPRSGSMSLSGIAKALKDGGCTFDFIGFDACLMATLETAMVAEPYADYLIASEETEPGCGWYYTDWLTKLSKDPSMSALNIGKNIADSFVSVCGQAAPGQQATLSVIDLAELSGTVPGAFRDFAQSTNASIQSSDYKAVASARANAKEFAQSSHIDQIDLVHLADNMDTAQSRALAKALRGAVKYNATSRNISNANGVSIYFPYGKTSSVSTASKLYDQIGLDSAYTDCIRSFASLEVAGQAAAGGQSGQLGSLFDLFTGSSSGSSGGDMLGMLGSLLGGRDLANVGLTADSADFLDTSLVEERAAYLSENRFDPSALTWTRKDGQQVLALSDAQWDLVSSIALNVFVDDGEGYIDLGLDNVFDYNEDGDLIGAFDGTWMSVNGQIVAYYLLETDDASGISMGYIPALLNGQRVDLMVSFSNDTQSWTVLGAQICYDEDETSTVARGLIELQDGDKLDFLCSYYDYDKSFLDNYPLGETVTVDGPLVLGNLAMDNTDYIAAFRVTDIYQNHYWTPEII